MTIQEQKWHDFTRLLLVEEGGSVQLELYDEPQEFGATAFLYALWVDESHRRQGIAGRLMEQAEHELRKRGHKSVCLEWKLKDTPVEIFKWYERLGYDEKSFDGHGTWALMIKELN